MTIILLISVGLCLSYILLISRYISGWNSVIEYPCENNTPLINVNVIVAFRDEEENLPSLLNALHEQSYPSSFTEIIFVDDHSKDNSSFLVQEFIDYRANTHLIRLNQHDAGKKMALSVAAASAKGELLIFTDADTIPGKNWIKTIVSCYVDKRPVLIASPVIVKPAASFFNRFQSLEFFSLIGTTSGSFGLNDPIMLNGANFAIERNAYLDSINYLQSQTLSGDDVFLLLHLKKNFSGRLIFLKSAEASVSIKPLSGVLEFVRQRFRWTSKAKYYRDRSLILSAIIVLLINLWLLNCMVMIFFNPSFIIIGGGVFIAKTMVDYFFLRKVLRFFKMENLLKHFVLSQFLYFLYISFIGIGGNLFSSRWKGRMVK
jgi:cellulose synthase/poly-beta-1,6-N-acetylglucosamine synthase-like glycosyltransferase